MHRAAAAPRLAARILRKRPDLKVPVTAMPATGRYVRAGAARHTRGGGGSTGQGAISNLVRGDAGRRAPGLGAETAAPRMGRRSGRLRASGKRDAAGGQRRYSAQAAPAFGHGSIECAAFSCTGDPRPAVYEAIVITVIYMQALLSACKGPGSCWRERFRGSGCATACRQRPRSTGSTGM